MNSERFGNPTGNKNILVGLHSHTRRIASWTIKGVLLHWERERQSEAWKSTKLIGGHSAGVKRVVWGNGGAFLLSCSYDQTTRAYVRKQQSTNINDETVHLDNFYEFSRAQIHGYDIGEIGLWKVGQQFCDYLVCGAQEKVLRILEPSVHFVNYVNYL